MELYMRVHINVRRIHSFTGERERKTGRKGKATIGILSFQGYVKNLDLIWESFV